jgi:hypothetical protein
MPILRTLIAAACLTLALGSAPAAAQPTNSCGTIRRFPTCAVFQPDGGGSWFLTDAGPVIDGQRVRVRGMFSPDCVTGCPQAMVGPCEDLNACRADFDLSGEVSIQDLFTFLQAFFGGTLGPSPPDGDFDGSGEIGAEDLFQFLAQWFTSCP